VTFYFTLLKNLSTKVAYFFKDVTTNLMSTIGEMSATLTYKFVGVSLVVGYAYHARERGE
jgi:predicted porin